MPHQCLSCGATFADGSTDLLKGCPDCEGTRFFFTDEPVSADARAQLQEQTDKDVHSMLKDLLASGEKRDLGEEIWSKDAWEDWVRLEPGEQAATIKEIAQEAGQAPDEERPEEVKATLQVKLSDVEEVDAPAVDAHEAEAPDSTVEPAAVEPTGEEGPQVQARPSTLNILEPGNYEIDVERLMDDSPVIVERDGSYVIHLPSVFGKSGKR
ncbi:MAG: Zn-ribbon containing protein [Candidatus Thermoplasmatota archaeon]|nr:Zn-ribbon containing protein [Candidatus Thermoplasmatota archaeon]